MAMEALVGRDTEISMLQTFCRGADSPDRSLLLTGAVGVGKTALLHTIADWAEAEGYEVLRANGVRAERGLDFSTLNQLLLPLEGSLAGLESDEQRALSEALGFVDGSSPGTCAVASAALSLLRLAAADHPVLLVLDDAQWADQLSAQVLSVLVHKLHGSGTRLLGASRSHDFGFFDSRTVPCTPVLPLDPVAATELITRHFPDLDRRRLTSALARGGGNPLALLELPTILRADQEGGRSQRPPDGLPVSRRVERALAADIQELPAGVRALLLLLALDRAGDLARLPGVLEMPGLRPAERAGLVSIDLQARQITFTHPLVAFTVIGLATSDDRRTAHRRLAELLADWPEHQALHLAEAAAGPDEGLAERLESAAAIIARDGDAEAAVTVGVRSAALSENLAHRARRLTQAAHLSVAVVGDLRAGLDLLEEAKRCDPAVASTLRHAMASSAAALHGRGDATTAHRALVDAIESHREGHDADPGLLEEATRELLDLCRWTQRPEDWSSLCAGSTPLPSGGGVVLRLQVATLVGPLRDPADVLQGFDAELERFRPGASHIDLVRVAECALHAGGLSPYRQRLEAVVADGRARDGTPAAIDALCCLAQDAFTTGDWDRALTLVDEGLAWCDALGQQLRAWTLRWVRTLIGAARGELPAVRQATVDMLQWADGHGIRRVATYAHHARALAALGSGQFELAYQEATAVAPAGTPPPRGSGALDPALYVVEAALHTYRVAEAARQATVLQAHGPGGTSPRIALLVAASTAMVASERDRGPLLERALAEHSSADHPFDLARVHLAYGQHLRRSRGATVARAHLRTALDTFQRLGAQPWAERTRIELDATAETRNQVEPGLTLTPQERTVALLAAAGHTNKQIAEKLFLTHRTVSAHLRQVFPKLGVASRAALRDALSLPGSGPLPDDRLLPKSRTDQSGVDRGPAARQHRDAVFAKP